MGPFNKWLDCNPKKVKRAQVKQSASEFSSVSLLFAWGSRKLTPKLQPEKHVFEAWHQLKHSLLFFPTTALHYSCTTRGIKLKHVKTNKNKIVRRTSSGRKQFAVQPHQALLSPLRKQCRSARLSLLQEKRSSNCILREARLLSVGCCGALSTWDGKISVSSFCGFVHLIHSAH